eukprot:6158728-Pyramimonas_sp.AAC.1
MCVGRTGGSEQDGLRAGGMLDPSPYPFPWSWRRGGGRGSLERPQWPRMALGVPQRNQDDLQDGPK